MEPIPNIIAAPIFWARGIFSLMIVGIGMTKRMMSDTMLATAMHMYSTGWLTQLAVSASSGFQLALIGLHPKSSRQARTVT